MQASKFDVLEAFILPLRSSMERFRGVYRTLFYAREVCIKHFAAWARTLMYVPSRLADVWLRGKRASGSRVGGRGRYWFLAAGDVTCLSATL